VIDQRIQQKAGKNFEAAVAMNFATITSARSMGRSEPRQRRPQELSKASGRLRNWLNAVVSKEYIERLQMVIRQLQKCDTEHIGTESVHEVFNGQTVWQEEVEVFSASNHPPVKRAYAWSEKHCEPNEKFTPVLEIPAVESAITAVTVSIVAASKKHP
jgi:hypothetical protein